MTFSALKEQLHDYIDHAEEKKVKAMYTLLEDDIKSTGYIYDDETIALFEEHREEYIKSGSKGHSVEESMEFIKNELIRRGL